MHEEYLLRPVEITTSRDMSFSNGGEGIIYKIEPIKDMSIDHIAVHFFTKTFGNHGETTFKHHAERIPEEYLDDVKIKDKFSSEFSRALITQIFEIKNNFKFKTIRKLVNLIINEYPEIKDYL